MSSTALRGSLGAVTSSDLWDEETAARYDTPGVGAFAPEVLEPAVDVLELAIGTGRVAIPLARPGCP